MFIVIGTNYKYSPIEIRERLSIPKGKLRDALAELTNNKGIKGAVILSTCNRIEVYASVDYPGNLSLQAISLLGLLRRPFRLRQGFGGQVGPPRNDAFLYIYTGREAVSHLFEVACGLDSQIIGEGQILGQVEFAWQEAKRFGATDIYIDGIFDEAIKTAFKVRQKTRISAGNISVASIVLDLIDAEYGPIKDKKILLIGVGKISELIVRHLKDKGARSVFIANKTYEKARQLARSINAEVVRFDALKDRLKEADIVISATGSPHLVLRKEDVVAVIARSPKGATKQSQKQDCFGTSCLAMTPPKLLIIDLAVPRDVDPDVKDIEGVKLFNLDDLDFIIDKMLSRRKQEIPRARDIINEEVKSLCSAENLELEPEPALLP